MISGPWAVVLEIFVAVFSLAYAFELESRVPNVELIVECVFATLVQKYLFSPSDLHSLETVTHSWVPCLLHVLVPKPSS